ncbi:hypothetical protein HZS61_004585 [Fusarium oxysporum f. sp. conglutinans]|uniref:Heterokaryon incompatibility domain-containing protein n=1 Tax=Fusarium oxysporum f. sp. conglutinans TaxID=100902 RepID=A0A8H6GCU3_FUSOX|nr:hypothetical protein HZS61_004585 [Fusarium oxysporum f. sp. conglutinans]
MSLRVAPTGNSSSSASRLCSWCEKFVGREPSDDVGLTAQSPKAIERAAKHGCYICGWLALTFNAEALQKLYLNVPSSKTRALLSISLTKIDKSFDTGIGPPSVILNVIHDTGYAGASHPYDPPNSLQLESASFRNLATTWMEACHSEANEHKDAHPMSSYERWWNMVRQYANTNLSHEGDRVIAFSGVAQAFRISHNISGQYLAGIWSCNLPKGLLWCREPNDAAGLRSKSYKAPSWSWMSIDGDYILHEGFQYATKSCCSIEQIYVHLIDETHDTGLLNGGALRIHGHLIGPIPVGSTIDTLDEDILRCHVRTEEEADDGVCMVNEDEEGPDGVPFISYLDGLDPELGRVGLMSGAFRQTIAFSDAEGSIFCLPIVYRYEDTEEPYESELSGLILYNPPHQRGIYHRIGYYEMECKAIPDFNAMLREQHPPQSILLL